MESTPTPWDDVFRQEGRFFLEPAPVVVDLAELLKERGCSRVLDLGCGTGRHLVYLTQQGFQLCGLDNSPNGLRLTQDWLNEVNRSAGLLLADVGRPLPFCDGAFDALLSTQVIHHARLATVRSTADEIGRVLRRGGVLLVTVPAHRGSKREWVEIEPDTFVPMTGPDRGLPHHFFTPEALCALFSPFKVLEVSVRGDEVIALVAVKG